MLRAVRVCVCGTDDSLPIHRRVAAVRFGSHLLEILPVFVSRCCCQLKCEAYPPPHMYLESIERLSNSNIGRCHAACIHRKLGIYFANYYYANANEHDELFFLFSPFQTFFFEHFIVFRLSPRTYCTLFFIVRCSLFCVRNKTLILWRALCLYSTSSASVSSLFFSLTAHSSPALYCAMLRILSPSPPPHSLRIRNPFSHVHSIQRETFISIISCYCYFFVSFAMKYNFINCGK